MALLKIAQLGNPVLRERAQEVTAEALASPEVQRLIDDLIETMREAAGAGLAAPQVHVPLRIFVVEVRDNPRYPYKPEIPLHVVVNPTLRARGARTFPSYEGCLSVPDVRGLLPRFAEIELQYVDRDGREMTEVVRGLSAGTFQHELDHLDGILFLDRVEDPRTLTSWLEFQRHHETDWLESVRRLIEDVEIVSDRR
jgi:peptide deformylase